MKKVNIGVIGGGSWATAIVKILTKNVSSINWWMRNEKTIECLKKNGYNKKYLSNVKLNPSKLNLSSDINETVKQSDFLILSVPSPFLKSVLKNLRTPLKNKFVVSAIKGIVPENNVIVGEYLHKKFNVPYNNIGIIAGPCHAEEISLDQLSYLTIACVDLKQASFFANLISCSYVKVNVSNDIYGTEYNAVLKNIVAIASGICYGLGYGDNFQAVLVSNAIREIKRFMDASHPIDRDIKESAYLGDLLVTSYSKFSRNRNFGELIGKGHSIASAKLELKMIAEGYYAVKCIREVNKLLKVNMPISSCVYNILYENASAEKEIISLTEKLN